MKLRYLIVMLGVLLLAAPVCHATWLICHQPEFIGRIVDIETDQPIEGALIIAFYQKNAFGGPGGKIGSTIHAKEALTDKNGYFRISSYWTLIQPFSWCDAVTFIVFKPGYLCFGENNLEDVFTGTLTKDVELFPAWNKTLKYRLTSNGTIKLPKVRSFEDRNKSSLSLRFSQFQNSLPISRKIKEGEISYLESNRERTYEK